MTDAELKAEFGKLGPNAEQRIEAASAFLRAQGAEYVVPQLRTAESVEGVERLMSSFRARPSGSPPVTPPEPPRVDGKVDEATFAKMTRAIGSTIAGNFHSRSRTPAAVEREHVNMDSDEVNEIEAPTVQVIPGDAFADLAALLRLITDERACAKRLQLLRSETSAAQKAKAELEAARAEHDASIAKQLEGLANERKALAELRLKLNAQEGGLLSREELLKQRVHNFDLRVGRIGPMANGMSRVFSDDADVREEEAAPRLPNADEDYRAPFASGTTITRDPVDRRQRRIAARRGEL